MLLTVSVPVSFAIVDGLVGQIGIESPHDGRALPGLPNPTDVMPDSTATTNTRHIELHFASDDEAIELDVTDEPAGADLLLDALEADDVTDAERRLEHGLPPTGIVRRVRPRP